MDQVSSDETPSFCDFLFRWPSFYDFCFRGPPRLRGPRLNSRESRDTLWTPPWQKKASCPQRSDLTLEPLFIYSHSVTACGVVAAFAANKGRRARSRETPRAVASACRSPPSFDGSTAWLLRAPLQRLSGRRKRRRAPKRALSPPARLLSSWIACCNCSEGHFRRAYRHCHRSCDDDPWPQRDAPDGRSAVHRSSSSTTGQMNSVA